LGSALFEAGRVHFAEGVDEGVPVLRVRDLDQFLGTLQSVLAE
jgi:hypothetical protein